MENTSGEKLGKNLRALRKGYKLTQTQLGEKLGVSKSTISNYEKANVVPDTETLNLFVRFFERPIEDLINGDFTGIEILQKVSVETVIPKLKRLFPYFNEKKSENIDYQEGLKYHRAIMKNIETEEFSLDSPAFVSCRTSYQRAEKDGDMAAIANLLSLYVLIGVCAVGRSIGFSDDSDEKLENESVSLVEFFSLQDHSAKAMENRRHAKEEYLGKAWVAMRSRIRKLKTTSGYTHLGDYYLGILYLCDLIENGETREMNMKIGSELLNISIEMGNPWVKRFEIFIPEKGK